MKKYLIFFSLFTFHFTLSTLHAQDTLVLRNGQKMGVKVISVMDKISYSIPPGDNPLYIKLSKVSYIKYKDGYIYSINSKDTARVQLKPYIVIAGGLSIPFPNGYGGDAYSPDLAEGYQYSGYATTGSTFSATAGIKIYKGWELTGMFSYSRNPFDATQYMNATVFDLIEYNDYYGTSNIDLIDINAVGNYYYTNYSGLLGITKNWEGKHGDIGISLMSGILYTQTPALQATAFNETGFMGPSYTNGNCYFNLSGQTQANFDFEMALHADLNITRHLFLRGQFEFQFSRLDMGGDYQVVDMATGNVDFSGGYTGSTYNSGALFVWLTNITAGIGYKL